MVLILVLLAESTRAALVEYSYTGKETFIGTENQVTRKYSGMMIFDTTSSNVTFVSWRSDKTYHVSTNTNLHFTTVTGLNSKNYTVITHSASGTDTNGFYHLDNYMISGQNSMLTIAPNTTFVFPKTFSGSNNRGLMPDSNGAEIFETWGETMTFASKTQSDNAQALTSGDVVSALVAGLQARGYTQR